MHRTNIYLTEEQRAALAARAESDGTSVAELIRRVIDRALAGDDDDLAGDLAAIERSFGVLREGGIDIERSDGDRGAHLERVARQ